jgi:hypothetical protein
MTKDCQGIQCCLDIEFALGKRNICTEFKINVCDQLDYFLERKKWQRIIIRGIFVSSVLGMFNQLVKFL